MRKRKLENELVKARKTERAERVERYNRYNE